MTKTWLISDTHFGHDSCYTKFTDSITGKPIRPWAASAAQGDSIMKTLWNERIGPKDRVYHLGDVAIPRRAMKMMDGLHGRKILIRGNHDIFKLKDYLPYFEDIRGTHKLNNVIMSHYPLHTESLSHWCIGNIHGHTHSHLVRLDDGTIDSRYENVCVEHTAGGPIEFDEVYARFEKV
jgi:calcineurin-like phosphoesterase family protein